MLDSDGSRKDWRNQSLLSLEADGGEHVPPRDEETPFADPSSPKAPERTAGTLDAGEDRGLRARLRQAARRVFPPRRAEERELRQQPARVVYERPAWEEAPRPSSNGSEIYWQPLIDPMRVISGIVRAKWIIVLTTVLGALLGVLVALATPKEYYSAAELLFDPRDLQLVERDLTGGGLPSDATLALIENQVSIIRSGSVLNKVVDRLNLAEDPEFNGQGGGILGKLLNPRSLLSFGAGDEAASASTRRALAVQNLAESLNVERNPRTFIIHIGATTRDPEKSAQVVSAVVEAFLDTSAELQSGMVGRANNEITSQLDELRAEVERAEQAVVDFKTENDIVDAQGRLISDDEIVRLNQQLATARARTAELNARVESMRDLDAGQVLGGSLPEQVASPVMTELLSQYASLRQEADRASARLGPRHPDNQMVQSEVTGVREAIARELRRVVASIQVELRRAVELEQNLAARLARLKVENADREDERVTLRELEREAEARRSVYESFLLRARQTGQQRDLNTANVSVISQAYPPLLPTGTSRASIAIAGTVLGFLAGIGIGGAMGAAESLRENMGRRREPVRADMAAGRSNLADEEDFDPLPPEPDRPSRDISGAAPAAAAGGYRPDTVDQPRSTAMQPAYPSADAREAEEDAIEDIRQSLRAFRQEIDALAEKRVRRHG